MDVLLEFAKAGIFDGLTPCSFSIIIFFLSITFFICRSYRQVILWSSVFVLSVLAGTFLLGFGVFEKFRLLGIFDVVSNAVYLLMAISAIALGSVNLFDWWRIRRSKDEAKAILKVSITQGFKERSDSFLSLATFVIFSVITGFFLSIVSSSCVGQMYLPAMIKIFDSQGAWLRAIGYLAIYTTSYILPLFISWLFVILLLKVKAGINFTVNSLSKFKIISSSVFFGLGFGLIYIIN